MAQTENSTQDDGRREDGEDLAARFPNADTDERLRATRGRDLPEPPKVQFTPPALPQVQVMQEDTRGRSGVGGTGYRSDDLRGAGLASSIGVQLFVAIAGCTGLGWLADRYVLHSAGTPWGVVVGFFLGVVIGFMNMFRLAAQLNREEGIGGTGSTNK